MKSITSEELLTLLKGHREGGLEILRRGGLKIPLLIEGRDPLRVRRLVEWLRTTLSGGDSSKKLAELVSLQGSELQANPQHTQNLKRLLLQSSLFSPLQMVVIHNGEKIKSAPGKNLVELLKGGIAPSVLLLITAESFSNQKLTFLKDLKALGSLVVIEELTGGALRKWIEREAARVGGGITPEAAHYLAEHFSEDLTLLSQEVQKLSLFIGPEEKLSRELVERELFHHPERTSFQLVHEIARKNVRNATIIALNLVEQGFHPLQVSTFLSKAFRVLFAHHLKEELSSELGNAWFFKQLAAALPHFSNRDFLGALDVIRELDLQLKSSNFPNPLALSVAVEKMALRAW